jgi:hypothetical protein
MVSTKPQFVTNANGKKKSIILPNKDYEFLVSLKKKVVKTLAKIVEPYLSQLQKSILALKYDPSPNGLIKLKINLGYRVRVGSY